jgi:hypothetical protein
VSLLDWLRGGPACDHAWRCVRVVHGQSKGWLQPIEGPLLTFAPWRCERCGRVKATEHAGWWTTEELDQ